MRRQILCIPCSSPCCNLLFAASSIFLMSPPKPKVNPKVLHALSLIIADIVSFPVSFSIKGYRRHFLFIYPVCGSWGHQLYLKFFK
ncbi:hypothetical protein F5J12DRAFT_338430 [Pisolithus orientalis]|uniref:uncharacterized protein n=1 Tax=Pisolithus orientalis TaxID=936130 RepID=UPI0022255DD5|nr:uncharacterized protein F5J12DRAFT_338430 [Pisolithus orientalis]KAI5997221.1 hypothetical protein F5J12DRAFT_338430 [Pisolithus orientalis]